MAHSHGEWQHQGFGSRRAVLRAGEWLDELGQRCANDHEELEPSERARYDLNMILTLEQGSKIEYHVTTTGHRFRIGAHLFDF